MREQLERFCGMGGWDSADPSHSVQDWMSVGQVGCVVTGGFLTVPVLGMGCQVGISLRLTIFRNFVSASIHCLKVTERA